MPHPRHTLTAQNSGLSKLVFRVHTITITRMFQRRISETDVRHVLETGEIIEAYPQDSLYPSRLILGWHRRRPIHIVVADDLERDETIVITVYQPDQEKWEPGFKTRRAR